MSTRKRRTRLVREAGPLAPGIDSAGPLGGSAAPAEGFEPPPVELPPPLPVNRTSVIVLDFPSAANPPVIRAELSAEAAIGDLVKRYKSQHEDFSADVTSSEYTLVVGTTPNSTAALSPPSTPLPTSGPWYFYMTYSRLGVESDPSNVVAWNDPIGAVITTAATYSIDEYLDLAIHIGTNKTVCRTWISGGNDQIRFALSENNDLMWINNNNPDYDYPASLDGTHNYYVTVSVQTLAGVITSKDFTVSVLPIDKDASPFFFPTTYNGTPGVHYQPGAVAVGGMAPGLIVPCTVVNASYSLNGAAFVPAGTFNVTNGSTVNLDNACVVGNIRATMTVFPGIHAVTAHWDLKDPSTVLDIYNKGSGVTTAGTPPLYYITYAGTGDSASISGSDAKSGGIRQFEYHLENFFYEMIFGVYPGVIDFSSGPVPGRDGVHNGFVFGSHHIYYYWGRNNTTGGAEYGSGGANAGDFYTLIWNSLSPSVDPTNGQTIKIYLTRAGVTTLRITQTGVTDTTLTPWFGSAANNTSATVNFGSSSFVVPLVGGAVGWQAP